MLFISGGEEAKINMRVDHRRETGDQLKSIDRYSTAKTLDRGAKYCDQRVCISVCLLSTHADRQGVDISVTVCLCWLYICTVTDFSGEDKASGVKFCTAVHRRPRHVISPIFVNFAPPEAQNRTNRPTRGPRPPACKHYRRDAPT